MTRVEVFIQLKPGLLDPQGETLTHALESLGHEGVSELRVGKWITFLMDESDRAAVEREVEEMCERLLANPVIESFEFRLDGDGR
ncbi:MAG TPA: phosphoribosylformylglycinamidine synthase subunit PurS [Gemmatimonadota bacterium]|nr:phosphoribosylformylglycinamidine synthase subunit PurS [Gemmatimonadota bacterium]